MQLLQQFKVRNLVKLIGIFLLITFGILILYNLVMASYFDELHVEEDEIPTVRIERLTRETFRMLFDHDPARYGDIINFQNTPPASKSEIAKLKAPSFEELIGKHFISK